MTILQRVEKIKKLIKTGGEFEVTGYSSVTIGSTEEEFFEVAKHTTLSNINDVDSNMLSFVEKNTK